MLKKIPLVILVLLLLLAPLVGRWFYHYTGSYRPEEVARPDLSQIEQPVLEAAPFVDSFTAPPPGAILVDLSHDNRVQMSELNVLQARLSARGQRLEPVTDLPAQLRYAGALVVISPGLDWTQEEIQAVQRFVDKGGRLLLVTDPTRFGVIYDEWGFFVGLDHDVTHINDLAARFGLVFQADYLYNTVDNAGNYRNIKLSQLAAGDLTQGLQEVIFYAAHSIVSEEPALIATGGDTRSSTQEGADELAVAVLAGGGDVLALGDLTFMTEPYNAVSGNDLFLAHIADFLSGAQRAYELADFPHFFRDQVDLVYAGDPLLNSDLLQGGADLQALLDGAGKVLSLRDREDEDRDTLFFGLYEQSEDVDAYLAGAGVSLVITPTATLEEDGEDEGAPPPTTPTPTPLILPDLTPTLTVTAPVTPSLSITVTPQALTPKAENGEEEPRGQDRVEIESLGRMVITGTSLLLLQPDGPRHVLVVLADTETGLDTAIERLALGDLAGCLFRHDSPAGAGMAALCPTGEDTGDGGGGWQEPPGPTPQATATPGPGEPTPEPEATPTPEPEATPAEPLGSILIISLDQGQGRYDSMTGAADYAAILEERYDVQIWSTSTDGSVPTSELVDRDLVIWTAGDFEDALGDEETDLLFGLMLEGTPVILSGAYIGEPDTEAVQRDILLDDPTHPLAKGFEPNQVIAFVSPPSGSDYEIGVLEDVAEGEGFVVFVRGPGSEAAGMPSILTVEDEFSEVRIAFIGFPIYLLPEEAKARLVINAVAWILGP